MDFLKQYGIYIGTGLILILIVIGFFQTPVEPVSIMPVESETQEPEVTITYIYVDIKGAVVYPGVYKVSQNTRLFQVVNIAGGLTEEADVNAINQSIILRDQDVIYVPTIEENYPSILDQDQQDVGGVININTASIDQLEQLPGIGPATAQSIIDYRNQNGPFSTIEDIMNVSGIGESTFEKIQFSITT